MQTNKSVPTRVVAIPGCPVSLWRDSFPFQPEISHKGPHSNYEAERNAYKTTLKLGFSLSFRTEHKLKALINTFYLKHIDFRSLLNIQKDNENRNCTIMIPTHQYFTTNEHRHKFDVTNCT